MYKLTAGIQFPVGMSYYLGCVPEYVRDRYYQYKMEHVCIEHDCVGRTMVLQIWAALYSLRKALPI